MSQGSVSGMVDDKAKLGHVVVSMVKGDVSDQMKKIADVGKCRRKEGGGFQIEREFCRKRNLPSNR